MLEPLRTQKMAAGGDAIARLPDGRVVFVRGALPQETVAARIVQSKRDFARADVVEVVEPSADRVEPPCPAYHAGCGGCPWQFVAAAAQLDLKAAIVREALRRTGKIVDPAVTIGAAVQPWAYRTTLRAAVTRSGSLGLRARGSHEVVDLDGCLISHPLLEDLLLRVRCRGSGEVSLRVGAATGERSVAVADGDVALAEVPDEVGLGPSATVHETVNGHTFRISAPSFFQSGPAAAALLSQTVAEACADRHVDTLVDAYGGVGLLARTVDAERTVVVESSESACADAVVNLSGRNARVACTTVEAWTAERADLVIADPSRHGLGRAAVDVLAATRTPLLVLVSCDPVSLARDATLLRTHGYEHEQSIVLDLFPQTPHVEVVTRFLKR